MLISESEKKRIRVLHNHNVLQEQVSYDGRCVPKDDIVETFNSLKADENGCVTVNDLTEAMSALISIHTIEGNKAIRK